MKALAILLLLAVPALAHDGADNWIGRERRTNAAGALCCGEGDCHAFGADQVTVKPDGYHFPDGEVVGFSRATPSVDQFYWKCNWGGETKCVFAPSGAS